MSKPRNSSFIAAAIAALIAFPVVLPASAQSDSSGGISPSANRSNNQQPAQSASQAQQARHDMRASELIGKEVKDRQGKNVGKIQDLYVDTGAQRVHYAVLSFGGFLGMGDKLFALPMTAFSLDRERGGLILNVDEQRLRQAPGFAKNTWPNYGDDRYFAEVNRVFGGDNNRNAGATRGLLRGSELMGKEVNDRKGEYAGEIEDFVVDVGHGRISYVVLEFDKAWSPVDKLLPLPLNALTFPNERDEELVLNVDRSKINTSRGFDKNKWPELNASNFHRDMDTHFGALDGPLIQHDRVTKPSTSSGS